MQDLIFFFALFKSFLESSVVLKFINDFLFSIIGTNSVVFYLDLVDFTLFNQSTILIIPNLSLFASFKLFPSFLFNHCSICVQILSLQLYFFKFFG